MTIQADPVPMAVDEHGVIRVAGTRITLDTLLDHYNHGYTPEQLHRAFPSVPLADVHTVIGYYLRHKNDVDAYLAVNRVEAEEIRRKFPATPASAALRQRLLSVKKAQEEGPGASTAGG